MAQRVLLTIALSGLLATGHARFASAQDLSPRLKTADEVTVTFGDGHAERGIVESVSASSLTLRVDQLRRALDLETIQTIHKRGDSIRNGLLIGMGVGIAAGAVFGTYVNMLCNNEGGVNCPRLRVTSVVMPTLGGLAIGAAIDGSHVGRTLVWSRNRAMSIAPIVGSGALGVQANLSLR